MTVFRSPGWWRRFGELRASPCCAVYFSTNAVLDGPDTPLHSQSHSQALAVGGSYQVTNTVTIPANAPPNYYLIVKADDQNAVFEANETNNWRAFGVGQYRDADGDGIPDWWEQQYFGSASNCDPEADPDGDGYTNMQEYIAGTDPLNPASALRITAIREVGNNVELDFVSISGKMYKVESKDALSDATWTQIDVFTSNITGTQPVVEEGVVSGTTQLFYRVKCGPNGEVVTDPAGYYGVTLNAGPNAVSVPLHNFATARGLVDSVSGNIVTVTGSPGWSANAFAPQNGFNQYILLVRKDASASPGIEGDWWTIASNTGNTLTLSAGTDVLSSLLGSGDQIEIRRLTSLKDVFGTGTTLILNKDSNGNAAAGDSSQADVIRFISGTSFGQPIFYHDGTILAAGYYVEGGNVGPLDGSTITVLPG
ncbi:MAG: CARDB domain-containing protein, partial [Verrucomicrobiota bacterium]